MIDNDTKMIESNTEMIEKWYNHDRIMIKYFSTGLQGHQR